MPPATGNRTRGERQAGKAGGRAGEREGGREVGLSSRTPREVWPFPSPRHFASEREHPRAWHRHKGNLTTPPPPKRPAEFPFPPCWRDESRGQRPLTVLILAGPGTSLGIVAAVVIHRGATPGSRFGAGREKPVSRSGQVLLALCTAPWATTQQQLQAALGNKMPPPPPPPPVLFCFATSERQNLCLHCSQGSHLKGRPETAA